MDKIDKLIGKTKYLEVTAKCSDLCNVVLRDEDNVPLLHTEGYVPSFVPNDGEDYISFIVDLTTGCLVDWTPPRREEIMKEDCEWDIFE